MPLEYDLLKGIPQEHAARFLALGSRLNLSSDQELFRLGAPADQLFVLARGRIALTVPMLVRGRTEDVLVEEKMPGETLGWSALVPPHRFTLNAVALVATEVLAFNRADLLDHFAENPAVGYVVGLNLAGVIGHRLHVFQTMWLREMQRLVEYQDS